MWLWVLSQRCRAARSVFERFSKIGSPKKWWKIEKRKIEILGILDAIFDRV